MAGAGSRRPLSQQFAPEDPVLHYQVPALPRDELIRNSTRHEPLPEKPLPQYPTLSKQPQQLAPDEPVLPRQQQIPRDELNRKSNRHPIATSPQKVIPKKPSPGNLKHPNNMDTSKESLQNGDLPHDQLIPLEELPAEEQPSSQQPCQQSPVADDQPTLRAPQRRQKHDNRNIAYNAMESQCIGIILIIIGICEILMNIIGIILQGHEHRTPHWNVVFYLGPGMWCAVFFILCGAFGIVAAQRRETWTIVTHLVVATLGTVFACILLALCAWGLHREYQLSLPDDGGYHLPSIILLSLMAFGALVAIPLTITASVLCCAHVCRKPTQHVDEKFTPY